MISTRKNSKLGVSSFVLGTFNILITIAITWALYSFLNDQYLRLLRLQAIIMEYGNLMEVFTKPLGLVLGIIGLFFKKKNRLFAILGTVINAVVILYTLALMFGMIF